MTEGEFPFRSFTMRSEGYDRDEVDAYVQDLQTEINELRRALETATPQTAGDTRLHDPEGAVTRTLAIAQETADRVLHDAQVESDRRRAEASEHATTVVAEADERAARLLGDMEAQAAEVREQGVAAARSAIQVERDKAMAELAHVRRVRDDLRTEAVDLKAALDKYRSQAREASDTLAAASSGPLRSVDLPDFIDDDVVLAGISATVDAADHSNDESELDEDADMTETVVPPEAELAPKPATIVADAVEADSALHAAEATVDEDSQTDDDSRADDDFRADDDSRADDDGLADVIAIGSDTADDRLRGVDTAAGVAAADAEPDFGGTFLAEVRAAAHDDDVALAPENDDSDRFLSELRGIADEAGDELDSDAADTFFDDK